MIFPTLKFEKELWGKGYQFVCGLDEVGRGAFAGPVVVGAVVFSPDIILPEGIADSKLLKPQIRERLSEEIKKSAICWAVGEIDVLEIDKKGIGDATGLAFGKAVRNLSVKPDFCLIDAFRIKYLEAFNQKPLKDGDKICVSISSASIIAKVYRDNLMVKLHQKYPQYNFAKHKGYGTLEHRDAIKKYGLCEIHRKSFNLEKFLS